MYNREYGTKTLTIDITFLPTFGDTPQELLKSSGELKSKFEVDILNSELNIMLNSGDRYNGFLSSFGEETHINSIGYISKSYIFNVMQIGNVQHIELDNGTNSINSKSLIDTPCIISVTNTTSEDKLVTFSQDIKLKLNVPSKKTLVVNASDKTISIDNDNAFLNTVDFVNFPILKSKKSNILIENAEGVTINLSYYPLYP